jgi:hypothetical protein
VPVPPPAGPPRGLCGDPRRLAAGHPQAGRPRPGRARRPASHPGPPPGPVGPARRPQGPSPIAPGRRCRRPAGPRKRRPLVPGGPGSAARECGPRGTHPAARAASPGPGRHRPLCPEPGDPAGAAGAGSRRRDGAAGQVDRGLRRSRTPHGAAHRRTHPADLGPGPAPRAALGRRGRADAGTGHRRLLRRPLPADARLGAASPRHRRTTRPGAPNRSGRGDHLLGARPRRPDHRGPGRPDPAPPRSSTSCPTTSSPSGWTRPTTWWSPRST